MINPEILHFGAIGIRWYGVCAAVGLLSAYWLQMCRRQKYNFTEGQVSDLTFFCMGGAIVGGLLSAYSYQLLVFTVGGLVLALTGVAVMIQNK